MFGTGVTVKVGPSYDFGIYHSDEFLLSYSFMGIHAFANTRVNAFYRILFWFGEAFVIVFSNIKSQKVKALLDVSNPLRKQGELQLFDPKLQEAYSTRWVVNCEPALASADHVIKYLGQYTHRVAITNQRILNIAGGRVTLIAKDYRDNAIKKPVTMDGVEFLRRFTMHILPSRFVKIRYFGIYNHTTKRNLELQFIP